MNERGGLDRASSGNPQVQCVLGFIYYTGDGTPKDFERAFTGTCFCGSSYPRVDIITRRTDDMVKVKGVNMFPAQFDEVLAVVLGTSSEYQVMIDHLDDKDLITLFFECGEPKEK